MSKVGQDQTPNTSQVPQQGVAPPMSAPRDDPIRFEMQHKLAASEKQKQEIEQKKNEVEQSLNQKDSEMKKMMQRMKEMEESLNMYQKQDKEKLRQRLDTNIETVNKFVNDYVNDDMKKSLFRDFQNELGQKIANAKFEPETIETLEKDVRLVETFASATQIQSSKYDEFLQKEREALKLVKERTEELEKVKKNLEESTKEHEETRKKLQDELEQTKKELEKAAQSIKNTESHMETEQVAEQTDVNGEKMDDLEREQVPPMQTGGNQAFAPQGFGANGVVETVAGYDPGAGANEMYEMYRAPKSDWRSLGTSAFTENMYRNLRR